MGLKCLTHQLPSLSNVTPVWLQIADMASDVLSEGLEKAHGNLHMVRVPWLEVTCEDDEVQFNLDGEPAFDRRYGCRLRVRQ